MYKQSQWEKGAEPTDSTRVLVQDVESNRPSSWGFIETGGLSLKKQVFSLAGGIPESSPTQCGQSGKVNSSKRQQ